jgi:hypothetical protein
MAKGKLVVKLEELPKLKSAADFCDVVLEDGSSMGDKVAVPFTYRTATSVFEMGRLIDKVTDDDLIDNEED